MKVTLWADKGENSNFFRVFNEQSSLHPSEKIYKGDSQKKICRFCGRNEAETKFKKKDHIIPEFMGNKLHFSNYECDDCNAYFGNLEDSLSNFAGVLNSLSTVKGKRGYSKFKDKKDDIEIFANSKDEIIARTEKAEEEYGIIRNIENGTITIEANQPSYIPLDAYKALVKIGLYMLPEDEVKNYAKAFEWIRSENTTENQYNPFFNIFRKVGGEKRFLQPWAVLYKKQDHNLLENFPHHTFLLFYGIITYQVFLPFHKDDEHLENEEEIIFPIQDFVIDEIFENGELVNYDVGLTPLWSPEKKKDRKEKFTFAFSEK